MSDCKVFNLDTTPAEPHFEMINEVPAAVRALATRSMWNKSIEEELVATRVFLAMVIEKYVGAASNLDNAHFTQAELRGFRRDQRTLIMHLSDKGEVTIGVGER